MAILKVLKTKPKRMESGLWENWFRCVGRLRRDYALGVWGDDLLAYNETASVGVLASGANKTGMFALAEFVTQKTGEDGPQIGRSDLWVMTKDRKRSWSFEFKQFRTRGHLKASTLGTKLEAAVKDAHRVSELDCDIAYGGLICVAADKGPEDRKQAVKQLQAFAAEADFAYQLSNAGLHPAFVFLKRKD